MWMTGACHKIHQTTGFDDVAELMTYTAVLDPASFTARRNFSPLKTVIGRAGLGAKRILALSRAKKILGDAQSSLFNVEQMDPGLDSVWFELAKGYGITRVRDAAYLNWKYADHPRLDYRLIVATRNGAPTGFLVWRPAPAEIAEKRAVIADFLVARDDTRTLEEMVARVLLDASEAGIDAVAIISTQTFAIAALQKLGFVAGGSRNAWVIANWKDVMPAEWVKDLDRWHMCLGDSDGDQWTGSM
jgi:hypothetical protein